MQKQHRLTSTKSFDYVHKRGKSLSNTNLVLIFVPTKYCLKVGFSVSKKIGKAVVRNKVKRRLREGFRLMLPFVNNSYNYVFLARNNSANCDYHELLRSMKHLINKAGLIIDKDAIDKIK